ncbi:MULTISPECIES: hypothetical protein [Vibrio]|uniref:hypothetical protein n=1 Tax=Vibrio TaxID=662 RepID=UPI0010D6DFF0|nr:hypothetical protein [Vibrio crassostreae]TCN02913.1 hypothetical protein EDB35_13111 [Vibrio crassostreae]
MLPSDSSELQAYVMTHNRMTQSQAQAWLDKWAPSWRTEEPNKPVSVIEYTGDDNEE